MQARYQTALHAVSRNPVVDLWGVEPRPSKPQPQPLRAQATRGTTARLLRVREDSGREALVYVRGSPYERIRASP